jgi:alpha-beta hydrolase superfamily lysophospholipase
MNATADMKVLAQEIAAFVTKARKATTAAKVVLVGHSRGAVLRAITPISSRQKVTCYKEKSKP